MNKIDIKDFSSNIYNSLPKNLDNIIEKEIKYRRLTKK